MPYVDPGRVWVPDAWEPHAGEAQCQYCSRWQPANADHFYRARINGETRSDTPSGLYLRGRCRECETEYRQRRAANAPDDGPVRRRRRSRATETADIVIPEYAVTDRRFGVELEFIGRRRSVATALSRHGIRSELQGYNHQVPRGYWKITTDESISPAGGELVSPPLRGEDGKRQVAIACQALVEAGAEINQSTGLHVHHEVRDLSAQEICRAVRSYAASQRAIDRLVSGSRRAQGGSHNPYCHAVPEHEVQRLETIRTLEDLRTEVYGRSGGGTFGRFRTINVCSFPAYGTIEIRQHAGTMSAKKTLAWVAFGQSLLAASQNGVDIATEDTDDLIAILAEHGNMDAQAADFLRERKRLFVARASGRGAVL